MRDAPSIERNPGNTIRLRPRPLHGHVAGTQDALANIVDAVRHMVAFLAEQPGRFLPDTLEDGGVGGRDLGEEHPVVLPDRDEAVQLVEE